MFRPTHSQSGDYAPTYPPQARITFCFKLEKFLSMLDSSQKQWKSLPR